MIQLITQFLWKKIWSHNASTLNKVKIPASGEIMQRVIKSVVYSNELWSTLIKFHTDFNLHPHQEKL